MQRSIITKTIHAIHPHKSIYDIHSVWATAGVCVCVCVCVCLRTPGMHGARQVPDFLLDRDEASLGGVLTHVHSKIARKASPAAQKHKNTEEEGGISYNPF